MTGPLALPEALGRRAVRISAQAAGALGEAAVSAVLRSPVLDVVARDMARFHVLPRVVRPLVDQGALDELLAATLDSPAGRRVVDRAIEEVAGSPAVTAAISHQGAGFAEQVAGVVRDRSRSADARLERAARRVTRRHADPAPAAAPVQPR